MQQRLSRWHDSPTNKMAWVQSSIFNPTFTLQFTCFTLCMLFIFHSFHPLLKIFSESSFFFKYSFRNTIRVSNSLDPDQARHFVWPDLGPNCLQRLSAENTSRQRIKVGVVFLKLRKMAFVRYLGEWGDFRPVWSGSQATAGGKKSSLPGKTVIWIRILYPVIWKL